MFIFCKQRTFAIIITNVYFPYTMKQFVFHNSLKSQHEGCGCLVGHLFITATHVVEQEPFLLDTNGETMTLGKADAVLYQYDRTPNGADVAVFRIPGMHSTLKLDTATPEVGTMLDTISYERISERQEGDTIFSQHSKEWFEIKEGQATITQVDGNFFLCDTSIILKQGASGSPVFRNGKVFGILHGGREREPVCLFQSAQSIAHLLQQKGI